VRTGVLQVVSRTSKLTYMWKGMAHLPALLQRLVKEEDHGESTTILCLCLVSVGILKTRE
jgi:hypothetical protein